MIDIMIDIRHISRCVIHISSQSGLYNMRFCKTISLAPSMSRIYHQLRPKKTRGPYVAPSISRLIFMRCHDNVQSVTFQSSPEYRTDTTIKVGTVYIHQMSQLQKHHHQQWHHSTTRIPCSSDNGCDPGQTRRLEPLS